MDDREKNNSIELSADTARMLRNVGSAMREALNGSMAAAELLGRRLEQEGRESERDYLAVMRHDQHRLLRIAENLTELGELTLGEARAEQSVQDLNQICSELVDTVSALTDRVRLEFTPCRESCGVNGSRDRLEALILNVLAYSLQRCGEGCVIRLRTESRKEAVCLYLQDNGDGPEGETISTLYSALESDPVRGITQGGAGLGLLVAEEIARLYGGSLLLSADGKKGMEAILTLPHVQTSILRLPASQYGGRLRGILTILSDELGRDKYMAPYL
jgi:signal transduction histidine kinase